MLYKDMLLIITSLYSTIISLTSLLMCVWAWLAFEVQLASIAVSSNFHIWFSCTDHLHPELNSTSLQCYMCVLHVCVHCTPSVYHYGQYRLSARLLFALIHSLPLLGCRVTKAGISRYSFLCDYGTKRHLTLGNGSNEHYTARAFDVAIHQKLVRMWCGLCVGRVQNCLCTYACMNAV